MQLIIDRFEGQYAICEKPDRGMLKIPRQKIPAGACEDDILQVEGELFSIDLEATELKRKAAAQKLRQLQQPE
jgi:hypothetical protein